MHDTLAGARTDWLAHVERTALEARQAGEIAEGTDVSQLAFELVAFLEMANAESVLHNEFTSYDKAARAVLDRLRAVTTDTSLLPDGP